MKRLVLACVVVLVSTCECFLVQDRTWEDVKVRARSGTTDNCARENCGQPLILTPFLKNDILKAQELARVSPAIKGTLSYSGYFTVNQSCCSNIFFWFFPAQQEWETAPLVLWLQGGPGASSLYGLFHEIGPLTYNQTVGRRENPWNIKNNLLFIDQPVGAGFSFSDKKCYPTDESEVAKDLYEALIQFYTLFPRLQENKFIIAGESFAGNYIPAIGYEIHTKNKEAKYKINLVKMMIGNGWMDATTQSNTSLYLYEHGLIDYKDMQMGFNRISPKLNAYNYLESYESVFSDPIQQFLNYPETRRSLHVGNISFDLINYDVHGNLYYDHDSPIRNWIEELLEHYPMVFYNGQLDTVCPHPLVTEFLHSLYWSGAAEYDTVSRKEWCVDDKLAGYWKSAGNLHEVMVRNAGHMVPHDQPLWAFILMDSITSSLDNPLDKLQIC